MLVSSSPTVLCPSFFFNPLALALSNHPFHSSFAPVLATPFSISRNADTHAGDPLDSPGISILTGDKRSEESNEISTSFTIKVCLILKRRVARRQIIECADKRASPRLVSITNNSKYLFGEVWNFVTCDGKITTITNVALTYSRNTTRNLKLASSKNNCIVSQRERIILITKINYFNNCNDLRDLFVTEKLRVWLFYEQQLVNWKLSEIYHFDTQTS